MFTDKLIEKSAKEPASDCLVGEACWLCCCGEVEPVLWEGGAWGGVREELWEAIGGTLCCNKK